jgi:hypothetical protein
MEWRLDRFAAPAQRGRMDGEDEAKHDLAALRVIIRHSRPEYRSE